MLVSEQLIRFIEDSGESRTRIAREAKVDYKAFKRFLENKADIYISTADKIAHYLNLELVDGGGKRAKRAYTLSEQLQFFLKTCTMTHYRIAKDSGVRQIVITRFLSEKQGIRMIRTVDKLACYLGLTLQKDGEILDYNN